ncbi:MAG: MBL fold metallo-hydrolase [Spirochaetota bacterium]
MRFNFLGTGTSHGVPVIACRCPVCLSSDPRDCRWRTSLLVEDGPTKLVVDAGPEFRLQALAAGIDHLDAILLTHAHADHIHGLDDIRPLAWESPLPVYGNAPTLAEVAERFAYAFREGVQAGGGKPRMELRETPASTFSIGTISVTPLEVLHGLLPILGYRFGDFAWLPDCSGIPLATMTLLQGTSILAIDALRDRPHPTHQSIAGAIGIARELGVRETWLIHMTHDHSHAWIAERCEELGSDVGARPAWDGLEVEILS